MLHTIKIPMLWLYQEPMDSRQQILESTTSQQVRQSFNHAQCAGIWNYGFKEVKTLNSKISQFKTQLMQITSFGRNTEEKSSGT